MKKNKGFSLTEVITTVLIIAILGAISGPIYNSYSTKSKQSEGYLLLGTIKDAQLKRYNDTGVFYIGWVGIGAGQYGLKTCKDDVLGIDARANKYYTYFMAGTNFIGKISANTQVSFAACVYGGTNASNITMFYNITSGTTIV